MIQRKQTIFLLVAIAVSLACLFLPLGNVQLQGMGVEPVLFNLSLVQWTADGTAVYDFSYSPLFFLIVMSIVTEAIAIFMYRKRVLQARLCSLCLALMLVWMLLFVYDKYVRLTAIGMLDQSWSSYLPFIAAIFDYLAYKGIRADEKLVRAADRIR